MIHFSVWCPMERIANLAWYMGGESDMGDCDCDTVTVEFDLFNKKVAHRRTSNGFKNKDGTYNFNLSDWAPKFTPEEREYFYSKDSTGRFIFTGTNGSKVVYEWDFTHGKNYTTEPVVADIIRGGDKDHTIKYPPDNAGFKWAHQENGDWCGLPVCFPEAVGYLPSEIKEIDSRVKETDKEARPCWQVTFIMDVESKHINFFGPADFPRVDEEGIITVTEAKRNGSVISDVDIALAHNARSWWDNVQRGQGGEVIEPTKIPELTEVFYWDPERDAYWPIELVTKNVIQYQQQCGSLVAYRDMLKAMKIISYLELCERSSDEFVVPDIFIRDDGSKRVPVVLRNDEWVISSEANDFFYAEVAKNVVIEDTYAHLSADDSGLIVRYQKQMAYISSLAGDVSSFGLALAHLFALKLGKARTNVITAFFGLLRMGVLEVKDCLVKGNTAHWNGNVTLSRMEGPAVSFTCTSKDNSGVEDGKLYLLGCDDQNDDWTDKKPGHWRVVYGSGNSLLNIYDPVTESLGRGKYGEDVSYLTTGTDFVLRSII